MPQIEYQPDADALVKDVARWHAEADRLGDELASVKAAQRLSEASSLTGATRMPEPDRQALRAALRAVYGRMDRMEAELRYVWAELGSLSYILGDDK